MNPTRKTELLAALRTPPEEGGYLQCQAKLYGEFVPDDEDRSLDEFDGADAFCCLGVATNLMVLKGELTWDTLALSGPLTISSKSGSDWVLDEGDDPIYEKVVMPGQQVCEYYGFSPAVTGHLAEMNDEGRTFTKIADWIEENL